MATIAGSAIDVDVLETKNTASSSRPSSRLANTGNTSDTNNNNTNSTTHQTSTPTTHQRTNSSNLLDANENKEENKNVYNSKPWKRGFIHEKGIMLVFAKC